MNLLSYPRLALFATGTVERGLHQIIDDQVAFGAGPAAPAGDAFLVRVFQLGRDAGDPSLSDGARGVQGDLSRSLQFGGLGGFGFGKGCLPGCGGFAWHIA